MNEELNTELMEDVEAVAYTAQQLLTGILNYLTGTPPPWNPLYDLNVDGLINIIDLLICFTLF